MNSNMDFCFVLIRGKRIDRIPLSNEVIGRITKIVRNQEREQAALLEMAKHDPVQ